MLRLRALLARATPPHTKMVTNDADISKSTIPETKLPSLSPEDFAKSNWMAVRMDYFVSLNVQQACELSHGMIIRHRNVSALLVPPYLGNHL